MSDVQVGGAEAFVTRDLEITRGGRSVLRGVNLELTPGEVVAVVGPNGAGKSSLLGALSGDLKPASGQVLLHGKDLSSWSASDLARERAVLLQQVTVSFPFTVEEVVAMGRAPWNGFDQQLEDDDAIAKAIKATEVEHLAGRRFLQLSGGERARVALARVLAQRTKFLLLDEPTAALDLRHQELVLRTARNHAHITGGAVMVVLHDIGLAAAYADRILILENGEMAALGAPRDVLDSELLSRVYQYEVEVFPHPVSGQLVILPIRH